MNQRESEIEFTPRLKEALLNAQNIAGSYKADFVGMDHVFLSLLRCEFAGVEILKQHGDLYLIVAGIEKMLSPLVPPLFKLDEPSFPEQIRALEKRIEQLEARK